MCRSRRRRPRHLWYVCLVDGTEIGIVYALNFARQLSMSRDKLGGSLHSLNAPGVRNRCLSEANLASLSKKTLSASNIMALSQGNLKLQVWQMRLMLGHLFERILFAFSLHQCSRDVETHPCLRHASADYIMFLHTRSRR